MLEKDKLHIECYIKQSKHWIEDYNEFSHELSKINDSSVRYYFIPVKKEREHMIECISPLIINNDEQNIKVEEMLRTIEETFKKLKNENICS